ncbi:hypothetical protein [Niameybacter massiliensis]|nr:hypothetical protein [Niameybacter massiliensis]
MYYAWVKHGWEPSKVYNMSDGELKILRAMYIIEIEGKQQNR